MATAGNFLLDSQMQLAGNPSLIDPTRAAAPMDMVPGFDVEMLAAIRQLPTDDQSAAIEQVICPVTDFKLGSMGVPPKVMVGEVPVFLCCEGCRDRLLKDPESHLDRLQQFRDAGGAVESPEVDEISLPPIGPIQADVSDDSLPPIGEMSLPRPARTEAGGGQGQSASTSTQSGRVQ